MKTASQIRDRFRVPIIFMTGYSDPMPCSNKQKMPTALDCLVKPVSLKNVLNLIDAYQAKKAL